MAIQNGTVSFNDQPRDINLRLQANAFDHLQETFKQAHAASHAMTLTFDFANIELRAFAALFAHHREGRCADQTMTGKNCSKRVCGVTAFCEHHLDK